MDCRAIERYVMSFAKNYIEMRYSSSYMGCSPNCYLDNAFLAYVCSSGCDKSRCRNFKFLTYIFFNIPIY